METNSIIIKEITPEALSKLINEGIKNQLDDFKKSFGTSDPDTLLSRDQVCEMLHINLSTLHHWTVKGRITAYGIGSRRYYKKSEVLECVKPLKK
jgi:excisionase family DNA binding protein